VKSVPDAVTGEPGHDHPYARLESGNGRHHEEAEIAMNVDLVASKGNVISILVSAKRLTEDESRALIPKITIAVDDLRKNKSEPLPVLEDRVCGAVSIRGQGRM
jgi:hypothetical protein